ncbi:hypothetical protein TNCV_261231 [Trichonephila clavipes]|nr:hypothetical protein TNCV_261231 [Trichonephila clavipes]
MPSFLVLREGDNRNRWRDGQVYPDVGQGIMAPWARRPGCEKYRNQASPVPACGINKALFACVRSDVFPDFQAPEFLSIPVLSSTNLKVSFH